MNAIHLADAAAQRWKRVSRGRAAAVGLGLLAGLQAAIAADLTVTFSAPRTATGKVVLALFNSAQTFPKAGMQMRAQMSAATSSGGTVTFRNLPTGPYAVSVFHDENANGKLDMNLVGIPTEAFGFSNDALSFGGPPSFEKAAIQLRGDTAISIHLR